jgi:hypothetical protein
MKTLYKILLVSILGLSLSFARTSTKFATPNDFLNSKNSPSYKKLLVENSEESSEQTIKWKRRHKRRKKSKNRRPQRGR